MNKKVFVECAYCGDCYKQVIYYYESKDSIKCRKCGDRNVRLTESKDYFGYEGDER
jgi:ribosomal protein S27E